MIEEFWVDTKDGYKAFYRTSGEGYPLILLHGSHRSSYIWHKNIQGLSEYFKVYAPDRPAYGKTSWTYSAELPNMEEFAINFASSLGIDKAFWIGESRGGGICIKVAAQNPNLVQKLVLVASIGLPPAELPKPAEIKRTPWEWFVERSFHNQNYVQDYTLKEKILEDIERARPYEEKRLKNLPESYNSEGLVREMALVSCPTLLIWGRNDPVFPVECTVRFKQIMSAIQKVIIIEKSRHLPFYEYSEEFNKNVIEFLKQE